MAGDLPRLTIERRGHVTYRSASAHDTRKNQPLTAFIGNLHPHPSALRALTPPSALTALIIAFVPLTCPVIWSRNDTTFDSIIC